MTLDHLKGMMVNTVQNISFGWGDLEQRDRNVYNMQLTVQSQMLKDRASMSGTIYCQR